MKDMKKIVFILSLVCTPVFAFDLGGALSNAIDRSANNVVNSTVNNVTNTINRSISSAIPSLDPSAKRDDGERVDLDKGVIIFGYDGCPYCRRAYSFLKSNNVSYQLMDTQKDAKASRIAREVGIRGVPVIYVEGEKITGYSAQSYRQLLQKHGKM
jgi:glutaredoxin